MVGGMKRRTPPRELARDPETWPHADLTDPGAAAVQHIAVQLPVVMAERRLSLRRLADISGVNRQVIADLLAGRSWPDVATVARLGAAAETLLWPQMVVFEGNMGNEASLRARNHIQRDRA